MLSFFLYVEHKEFTSKWVLNESPRLNTLPYSVDSKLKKFFLEKKDIVNLEVFKNISGLKFYEDFYFS